MKRLFYLFLVFAFSPVVMHAQNMGVGTTSPSEKLEVSGKIYTNEGGVKFPDQTVQTTAAYNLFLPPSAYAIPQGIGFIGFSPPDLEGPIDTIGLERVSIIYSLDITALNAPMGGSDIEEVEVLKQTDKASPMAFSYLLTQTNADDCFIYLTRKDSSGDLEVYFEIRLKDPFFRKYNQTLQAGVGGDYVHAEVIRMSFTRITLKDLDSNNCWCWDVQQNTSCNCY